MIWLKGLISRLRGDPKLREARRNAAVFLLVAALILGWVMVRNWPYRGKDELLNIAYDSSRRYFQEIDASYGKALGQVDRVVRTSHAGSVRQAGALARGLAADVVCLASEGELQEVARMTGCIHPDWKALFPYGSSPFTSAIVMIVRPGNPRQVGDWSSLWDSKIQVTVPSPASSGAGRYAYLTLWADALGRTDGDPVAAHGWVRDLFQRIRLLDLGAYQAFEVFRQRSGGDVFLTWESEALRITGETYPGAFEIVYPATSLLAEPVVAMMDCLVDHRGSRSLAQAYLEFQFSEEGQAIAARSGLRPRLKGAAESQGISFAEINLQTVEEVFGDWSTIWSAHFGSGGSFEQILRLRAAATGGVE